MKTTKLFFMTAMLLVSVCAFAQSENNEPLRGDVNGDGEVDLADVTELINIILGKNPQQTTYYWYAGTTAVDDTNYTSVSSLVTEIPATTNISFNEEYIYVVAPKTKTVTVLDANTQGIVNMKTYNTETHTFTHAETFVGDYKIYRSAQTGLGPFKINVN